MRGELRDILIRRANGEEFDMREWLAIRRLRFYENAEHAFANSISQTAMQLSFVKRARVDLQTSLGGRKGAGGVDVAGALRETDDDIVGWQLRGYAAEHGTKGLNTGLFYRRVVGGALAGVNVFADYEDGDDGDFWRWSVGGDVKNRLGELSANHYFAITDAQVVGGENVYTREGYDVDFAVRIPRLEWAKARVGYYDFKGEFGDEDENGFRAGLDLSPGDGLVVGVEYDDDDGKFGGNISYTHTFGEAQQESQRAGDFNPRAHFYDSARREYSQRISRTSGGGGEVVNVNSAINVGVFGGDNFTALTITSGSFQLPATGAVTATTSTDAGNATLRQGWELVIGSNAQIEFKRAPTATLVVTRGSGTFRRNNANITLMQIGGADITLLGTHFDFNIGSGAVMITLHEGGLGIPASGVSVVPAQGVTVVRAGVTMYCGGTNMPENCSFGMAATSADVMTAITAPAANDVTIGQFVIAQREGDIGASVSGAGFSLMRNGANLNILISSEAATIPNADVKRATLHLTDTAGLLSPMVSMVVFAVRVNSPDSVFGMMATGADVVTEVTAPASGDVIVGRYVLAQRHGDITASVGGAGFFAMTSQMSIINVLISQAAAATPDVNIKRVTLHLMDTANLLLPPVSVMVFTMRVNPSSITLRFVGTPVASTLTTAGDITVGTLEVVNGYNAQEISFTGARGDFRLTNVDGFANRRLLILGGDNTQARMVSVVVRGDDNNAATSPFMVSVDVSLVAIPPLTAMPIGTITITTGTSPASGDNNTPIFTVMASGGTPPYDYGIYNPNTGQFLQRTFFWSPRGVIQYRATNILYRFNSPAANEPGIEVQGGIADYFAVRDSSTPPRITYLPNATVRYVLPPPVTLSVNQTVNSTPSGASSVAVATLTYGGGSTGGALTATVVGVKDGFGEVSDNEVLMSASAAGEVIATINAYDSTNATAPNTTAQITVTFTGGG